MCTKIFHVQSVVWCVLPFSIAASFTLRLAQYCADVLFPEAMLQLHLLRSGHRRSARLLTPQEENALYERGQELLSEGVHWVTQIVQMRQLAQNSYKRRTKKKDEAPVELVGGTSTRPRLRRVL